jgi:acyl-[acyl-carrier-protein]-phospholipid O-acyltransferase/long-chain-fatty-acid--[acyl-carrier-protein] ligase
MIATLSWLLLLGISHSAGPTSAWDIFPNSLIENLSRAGMLGIGFFGGLFIVPLQVLMQTRPPEDLKGRMIGAMNLVNWLAICLAAAFVGISTAVLKSLDLGVNWVFGAMAVILVPVAIFYHPPDESLNGAPIAVPPEMSM